MNLNPKLSIIYKKKSLSVYDCGTHNTQSVDYPDYAKKVVNNIIEKLARIGILIGDTGVLVCRLIVVQK